MGNNQNIQWYPGHMTKTKRQIQSSLKLIDLVVEILDARIPVSSRNPDLQNIIQDKPKLVLLNKCDKASKKGTDAWIKYYSDNKAVARINGRGKIYAQKVGQATVYGETSNGQVGYADVLVVTLNRKTLPLRLYDTETLRVNEISTGVTWHSQNPLIASVDASGKVLARRRGTTRIYATVRGLKLSCRVTVSDLN